MEWIKDIKMIVFDLDGTLYQDDSFIKPYLTYLFPGESNAAAASMWHSEAERILKGQHAIKVGHFFSQSCKSGIRHQKGEIVGFYDWNGRNVQSVTDSLQLSNDDMQYIGDPWGVVGTIAAYADVPSELRSQAFMNVRRDMINSLNAVTGHDGVNAAIRKLPTNHKLLMTNSPQEAALELVAKLGLEGAFDKVVYGGKKPLGLVHYLQNYMKESGISSKQILSIGDNAWNELYPVKRIGGRTVMVSPYDTYDEEVWDLRLHTLDELEAFLLEFH